ncbi:hypothetical protein [Actinokineospora inagensis]|uniref:hypothetical protein n=1 Tax=Actinokineospora inagensis TaxID=103730 RepID=UPI00041BE9CF|nr:hypothetical protein [Actinokineospora inagensis]
MSDTRELEARVVQPHRATAAALALVHGDERLRRWDARKGITAPAEFRLIAPGRHHLRRDNDHSGPQPCGPPRGW